MSTKPNDFAVLIGVRDYLMYDPTGKSNVPGAQNDALTWVHQCLSMGFPPEQIFVLTSPVLSPEDLGPSAAQIKTGAATHEEITSAIAWILKQLAEGNATGLLTFSGHGINDQGRLLLCPSDTTQSLDNVIDVFALSQTIAGTNGAKNLTLVIDGCHSQVGRSRQESISAHLNAKLDGMAIPEGVGVAERVLSACAKDQVSVSARFLGKPMGAFTWALTSTLGQWKVVREGDVVRSTISYGDLVSRSRGLLSSLSFTQEPVLSGPDGVALLGFLCLGNTPQPNATSSTPNAKNATRQIDAGTLSWRLYQVYYTASLGNKSPQLFGQIIAVNTADTYTIVYDGVSTAVTLAADKEYWIISWDTFKSVSVSSVQVTVVEDSSSPIIALSTLPGSFITLQTDEDVRWEVSNQTLPAGSYAFSDISYQSPQPSGLAFVVQNGNLSGNAWAQTNGSAGTQAFSGLLTDPTVTLYATADRSTDNWVGSSTFTAWDVTLGSSSG